MLIRVFSFGFPRIGSAESLRNARCRGGIFVFLRAGSCFLRYSRGVSNSRGTPKFLNAKKTTMDKTLTIKTLACAAALAAAFATNASADVINFSDLSLPPESFWNGSDQSGYFESNGIVYYNEYNSKYGSYAGATYSNITQYTAGTLYNGSGQYAAAPLGGLSKDGTTDPNEIYSVIYVDHNYSMFAEAPVIDLSALESSVDGIYLSNTSLTVDVLTSPKYESNPAHPFTDGDWMKISIYGYDANMSEIGTVEFYLADYRDGKTDIVKDWQYVSFEAFTGDVKFLNFEITSSDNGEWGMNTPSFVAVGGFSTAVPEPSTCAAILGALAIAFAAARRRR